MVSITLSYYEYLIELASCHVTLRLYAKEPNICGLCDYTYQDDPAVGGGGVCCCDPSCLEPENGDCCSDYEATCGGGAFRMREVVRQ